MENYKQSNYLPIGYLINEFGEIISPKGKVLKQAISNSGYKFLNIKNKGYFVHRALAFCFINNIDSKLNQINHKDGNKLNNSLDNLEWCTKSHNMKHMYDIGLKKYKPLHYKNMFGVDHNRSKKVRCIESGIIYESMSEAGRKLKISYSSVSWSIKNKRPIFGMHFEIAE